MTEGNSLNEIAEQLGMDATVLTANVARYNKLCATGEATDLGKNPQYQYRYRHQEIIVRNRIKNFTISYLLVNCGILIAALQQHNVKREKDR